MDLQGLSILLLLPQSSVQETASAETEQCEKISACYQGHFGIEKDMSWSQAVRGRIIAECYAKFEVQGKRVLDVGCGNAVVSQILARKLNLTLVGTDVIDYRKEKVSFRLMRKSTELPFDDMSFDYAMFNDVLHHMDYPEELILEGARIASKLLIFEDVSNCLLSIVDVLLNRIYCLEMACPRNFKTAEEWTTFFVQMGFACAFGEICYPFWYPFRHMSFALSRGS